ncbi:hypothetical protein V525_21480 [Gordonia alkanivorans CGMCC 6845]|uniref:Uncharacterized protein n=1 Tax=Gordonia alkanivorans CGMCC 6845 TaxID=1423140 RepID=W9D6R6_9ACTN|nr:hypothetical protein V525_21480 [Gordonia alkanivorans CGMCC 6845]
MAVIGSAVIRLKGAPHQRRLGIVPAYVRQESEFSP